MSANENTELQGLVEFGEAITRLRANDDFKLVIDKMFIEGFAISQVQNMKLIPRDRRAEAVEETLARSILIRFLDMGEETGVQAAEEITVDAE